MKKLLTGLFLITALLIISMPATADTVSVTVNGDTVEFTDAMPFIDENGRMLVPLRPIAEAMGIDVEWDEATRTVIFTATYDEDELSVYDDIYGFLGHDIVTFTIGSNVAVHEEIWLPSIDQLIDALTEADILLFDDDVTVYISQIDSTDDIFNDIVMDTEAIIVDGRTYAPVRYLAEAMGYTVDWDAENQTVILTK